MGYLNSALSSSPDYSNHASIRRQCRHAGVANSMQYLVLLPGLALVDRGELFIQSRAHVTCKDGARAERYPKRYPNDTKIFPKAARVTDWSQNRRNRWWMLVVCCRLYCICRSVYRSSLSQHDSPIHRL